MNVYADLGTNVEVWEQAPSDTLADRSFAPISETGIELTNDYEPVVYQANRALMAANAAQEINELQERNHATTAYSTLDCNAVPLFPTFDAQRAVDCGIRKARRQGLDVPPNLVSQPVPPLGYPPQSMMGVPGYYSKGRSEAIVPAAALSAKAAAAKGAMYKSGVNKAVKAESGVCTKASCDSGACTCDIPCTCASQETCKCPACPMHGLTKAQVEKVVEEVKKSDGKDGKVRAFTKKMVRAAAGSAYDIKHWAELPPQAAGRGSSETFAYVVSRDNRGSYLLLWLGILVLFIALISTAIGVGVKRAKA